MRRVYTHNIAYIRRSPQANQLELIMTTENRKDKHRNISKFTTSKPIRWDNEDLKISQELAEKLEMTWTAFVKEAVKEKINRELKKK